MSASSSPADSFEESRPPDSSEETGAEGDPATGSAEGSPPSDEEASKGPAKPKGSWRRRLAIAAIVALAAVLTLWVAVHRVQWLGPAIADGLRSVLGPGPVAWMEDVAYGVQDRFNRWRYADAPPKTFWEAPSASAPAPARPAASGSAVADAGPAPFFPEPYEPPYPEVAAGGDGTWIPVEDPMRAGLPIVMYKSMVHPDPRRTFAALAVVAIDISAFELKLVAGTREPFSNLLRLDQRPGKIPEGDYDQLFAAFNGGFKATHGQYGMMVDGVDLLPPRDIACTFVKKTSGDFIIGTWSSIADQRASMEYYRQTPPCLVEDGELHELLRYNEYAKGWGATVSGETVIRRSSIGLDRDRKVLFYGLGEAMTARSLGQGMKAAGAHWAAELDVNHSYPRFLFYERPDPTAAPVATAAIIPGIDYPKDQYTTRPSVRDFFYLLRDRPKAP